MEFKVKLTEEAYEELLEEAKDDIQRELTDEAVKNYIGTTKLLNFLDLARTYNLTKRVEEFKTKRVEDLTYEEKFSLIVYWLMYSDFKNK